MEKKIYEAPHVQVIELECDTYLLLGSPETFMMGTQKGGDGSFENSDYHDDNPDDID